jgi:hypothetical protein
MDGVKPGPLQEVSSNPHKSRSEGKNLLKRKVRFIVLKTRRIVAQAVVQSKGQWALSAFFFILLRIA